MAQTKFDKQWRHRRIPHVGIGRFLAADRWTGEADRRDVLAIGTRSCRRSKAASPDPPTAPVKRLTFRISALAAAARRLPAGWSTRTPPSPPPRDMGRPDPALAALEQTGSPSVDRGRRTAAYLALTRKRRELMRSG
ncbi:hypothetical protein [Streptomyces sannanensis]|uniref:hypothetical protein n=1 Tax=Streptomyces sannanensis TaxID=285536 RepID=UPI0031E5DC97